MWRPMWRPTLGLHRPGTAAKDPLPRFGHAAKSGPAARLGPAANVVGLHIELHTGLQQKKRYARQTHGNPRIFRLFLGFLVKY